ncbi:DUF3159 domain-containing protein [Actinomyces slackii]|uniref:Protein of uncharacterized function (DUF3159) n=1 Tax=Actinomyces slackii TaxID=52774 RepID=A0A448KDT2_9ACTO|nr:DUF3159 domain-containing protein [Actinomyces slackii]VEG75068.1 Protein of uncharacterised function (DUF3159) [Actinomyces slackii]
MTDSPRRRPAPSRSGLGAVGAERYDAMAALGGWRGIAESVLPIMAFISVVALRPAALVPALIVSLSISAVGLISRLIQRQGVTQVMGGAALAVISALWAWRSGEASSFFTVGLAINAVWLVACLGSLVAGWPLVGVLLSLWQAAAGAGGDEGSGDSETQGPEQDPGAHDGGAEVEGSSGPWGWRADPAQREARRRYALATAVLAGVFALRLIVEVPLFLAGDSAVAALGVARIVLGLPLYALGLWIIWLLVSPLRRG